MIALICWIELINWDVIVMLLIESYLDWVEKEPHDFMGCFIALHRIRSTQCETEFIHWIEQIKYDVIVMFLIGSYLYCVKNEPHEFMAVL